MNTPTAETTTFLFTDIEGSTRLWQEHPDRMRSALVRHDQLLRHRIERHGGHVFKTVGDAFCAAFSHAQDALAAALDIQHALLAEPWPGDLPLRVRVGLHTGEAERRDNDYFGEAMSRVNRLMAVGHGGQVLLSQAAAAAAGNALPEGTSLLDLSSHRLKDLRQPEHVWQLCHPSLPSQFPRLRSLQEYANNLPLQMTSFVGREPEMTMLHSLLARERLVTLTGAGGCGKTRLALQAAAECVEHYGDGVWLVELAPLTAPTLVPGTVAQALGIREEPGCPVVETLCDALRQKSLLLVLDNCEHLLDACAALCQRLLQSCAGVRVLATSREALGLPGEHPWRVPPLSQPDPARLPAGEKELGAFLLEYESVRLFVDRARAQKGEFALSAGNARAVAQVCARLDGIPLALELAAARVRAMPVEQISARLDDRFRLLTGGSRTSLPRQQTLRALVDWSYNLLTGAEQALLCRLSVFAGGWTLEAAEAVGADREIEDWQVLDLLTSLVDKSLVIYEEGEDGRVRYRLLETVRQYTAEHLAEPEAMAVRRRHRDYFLALAAVAEEKWQGPEQGQWLLRIEAEIDNVRGALDFCRSEPGEAEAGLLLALRLWQMWFARGYQSETRERLRTLLALPEADTHNEIQAKALLMLGQIENIQSHWVDAQFVLEKSVAIWRKTNNQEFLVYALGALNRAVWHKGDLPLARSLEEELLTLLRAVDGKENVAFNLMGQGHGYAAVGRHAEAQALYEESLTLYRDVGDTKGIAYALSYLGDLAAALGDLAAARSLLKESLALRRALNDDWGIAHCTTSLGSLSTREGNFAEARLLLEEGIARWRRVGIKGEIAYSLRCLALLLGQEGDLAGARACLREAVTLCCEVVYREVRPYVLDACAALCVKQGQPRRGARLHGAAEGLREFVVMVLAPGDRVEVERSLTVAESMIGPDACGAAYAEGRAMAWEQAVRYALADEGGSEPLP